LGFDSFTEDVFAIEQNGTLVSACVSTRENQECGEAWVYTIAEYRHRGCAQKVVKAWARSLMDAGKVPFYSHKMENEASASLARKLGLRPVFEEISITSR
jgi:predicted GNAT family acetyltransferase